MNIKRGNSIWNTYKEKANVLKHGVDFTQASHAFADPDIRIVTDIRHSLDEVRYFCIGLVDGKVLTVRFMYRDGTIRIFGAGYWRKGKDLYEKKKERR